jgi:MtrB/PioB family decaheme-associated outer membrane protein
VFSPEPINHKHTQFNASLEHASKTYQLSAGYYGSVFKNAYQSVAYNNPTLANTVSLPSDNFFYSVYLDGAYQFTDNTRGTLRASYSKATQDEATLFFPRTAVNTGQTAGSLAGRVDNIELYGSLSSRLTKETKLLATWKFEKKDDKTPYLWFVAGDQDARTRPESFFSNKGKFEVAHNFGAGASLTGGYDYSQKRNKVKPTQYYEIYARDEIIEHTVRMAVRKNLSDAVNGSLTLARSDRTGSSWITPLLLTATTGGPVYPVQAADKVRDKVRAQVSWMASEALDVNGTVEGYFDDFKSNSWGIRKGTGALLSMDGNYRISDTWGLNAWYSNNTSSYDSRSFGDTCITVACGAGAFITGGWDSKIKYESQQLGLGAKGQISQFQVGMNYTYIHDTGSEKMTSQLGAEDMPRTKYHQNLLKMYGEYLAGKNTKFRVDYVITKYSMDDYAWQAASAYTSNTTAYLKPNQTTQVIGVTLTQSF